MSITKEYKVVKDFSCYMNYQEKLEAFLNELASQGWVLKTIFHEPGMAIMDLIFERNK